MPRILAVDWDRNEVRCVLAATRGKQVRTIVAGSAPLVDITGRRHGFAPGHRRLASRRVGRASAAGGRGVDRRGPGERRSDEFHPSAGHRRRVARIGREPGDAHPGPHRGAGWDFTALDDDLAGTSPVVAAVLPTANRRRSGKRCRCGIRPNRIVLRPFAAASLCRHLAPMSDQVARR